MPKCRNEETSWNTLESWKNMKNGKHHPGNVGNWKCWKCNPGHNFGNTFGYLFECLQVVWYLHIRNARICTWICLIWGTSSTAQGGGGSFKNRKPIEEVGCCESGMAKRIHWWTERCLRSPPCLSLSLTIYLPIYLLCIYLPIYLLCIYLSIYLAIYHSLPLFHLITYLPIYLSIYLSI